jgi:hypothetical protein
MKQQNRRGATSSKWALLMALLALGVCAFTLAACGGDDDTSGDTTAESTEAAGGGGGEEAKGEPIVTWTYTDVNT